jgi:sec-independent protein translocase protein TatA
MFDGVFAPTHWLILAVIIVLFFGYKRLPDASKSLARSMRIFKSEMKGFHDDEKPADPVTQQVPSLPAAPAAPQPAPVVQPVAAPVSAAQPPAAAPVVAPVTAPVVTPEPVQQPQQPVDAAPRS